MAVFHTVQPQAIPLHPDPTSGGATRRLNRRSGDFLSWLAGVFSQDRQYHEKMATLTASENYVSLVVRAAAAFFGGEHYFFDPPVADEPGEWSFPGSGALVHLQDKFGQQMQRLYGAEVADWRPNGGSACEQAVVMAACRAGHALVQMGHADGGHFGAGAFAERFGIETLTFPMRGDLIDVERTVDMISRHANVRLVFVQPSHGRRPQPIEELATALHGSPVALAVDVSHTAGLIAGGVLPQPLMQGADILTFNTHKTVPGPNKGVIAFADATHPLTEKIWDIVCPTLQSNSHPECLPGVVLALEEIATFGQAYAENTVNNARALARALHGDGLNVAGMEYGGTTSHQVHVVIGAAEVSHTLANERLPSCGIRTNSVPIPGTGGQFGLRLGAQALTRRGLTEAGFAELGRLVARAVRGTTNPSGLRREVAYLLADFPLFPLHFSFDQLGDSAHVRRLLTEVL